MQHQVVKRAASSGNATVRHKPCGTPAPVADLYVKASEARPQDPALGALVGEGGDVSRTSGLLRMNSAMLVAGARNAECYTVPEVYWIDLR